MKLFISKYLYLTSKKTLDILFRRLLNQAYIAYICPNKVWFVQSWYFLNSSNAFYLGEIEHNDIVTVAYNSLLRKSLLYDSRLTAIYCNSQHAVHC